jgi:UDP-N-acetylglucosamine--N-acetylmuramyl-(pentapeptide) pyrophosphoryl-undecaprenol N-acetylglucosamine transferase
MATAGAAEVIADAELSAERLRSMVSELFADPDRLARMGSAAHSVARPDAAKAVAREVLDAA